MTMRARDAKHIRTLWQDKDVPWHWAALKSGHNARRGRFQFDRGRMADGRPYPIRYWRVWRFYLHLTPIHVEHWSNSLEVGLCVGRRTVYVMRHW